ncbi:hypothetical protein LTR50_003204 [Elasticomyces elasticus]|nr:hypothetical protein LTR50_003204 [Elasticomyces elasticus]
MASQSSFTAYSTLQKDLSILSLAAPLLTNTPSPHHHNRHSNTSTSSVASADQPTPASLIADLTHYHDLFGKLRFSYVEQVTREKFLRAIVADPPELVEASEIVELGERLVGVKAALKAQKEEVAVQVEALESEARSLCERYESCQLQQAQLDTLPAEIANLESTLSSLQRSQGPVSADPDLNFSLSATQALLSQREAEAEALDAQIARLQTTIADKDRRIRQEESAMGPLEERKQAAIDGARTARQRRENGRLGDGLEEQGRWLRGVDTVMRGMLEV